MDIHGSKVSLIVGVDRTARLFRHQAAGLPTGGPGSGASRQHNKRAVRFGSRGTPQDFLHLTRRQPLFPWQMQVFWMLDI